MKVLYIVRDRSTRALGKRLHRWAIGFLDGQEGFFEAALHRAARVTRRGLAEALAMPDASWRRFDAVVVNMKCGIDIRAPGGLDPVLQRAGGRPVALLMANARPDDFCDPDLAARTAVLFKREPWADYGRYGLSASVADRIVPTHLSNPLAPLSYRMPWWERRHAAPRRMGYDMTPASDVFFLGSAQAANRYHDRIEAWSRVVGAGLTTRGGLLAKPDAPVPDVLKGRHLARPDYLAAMQTARVSLGLEGIGPFTFRHLEILWSGGFLLSTPVIREQRLRAPLVEGQDYVAFEDIDDLVDKCRHYATHDAERLAIARAGRAAYADLHDVGAHAAEIRDALSS